jgi:ubiquinone/menaquinone biosynthesis C-methylase UbiE
MASVKQAPDLRSENAPATDARIVDCVRDRPARFDRVARLYRTMEYLSFGSMLERCRFHFIPVLLRSRHALVLGDGDGRFLARLLVAVPRLRADAVDASSAMLHLLRERVSKQGEDWRRVTTTCADARIFRPHAADYDLVVSHFFLDCLTGDETDRLIARMRPHLAPGALWLVSEFQVPHSGIVRRSLAQSVISALYAGFGLLTGLKVTRVPAWRELLARHGFTRKACHWRLGGLLVSELWEVGPARQPHVVVEASTYQ